MLETPLLAAFLAFCRIGGCFLFMPGLSSVRVPMQVRLFAAVAATLALLAHLWDLITPHVSNEPGPLFLLVASLESLATALDEFPGEVQRQPLGIPGTF